MAQKGTWLPDLVEQYYTSGVDGFSESVLVELVASFHEGKSIGEVAKHLKSFGISVGKKEVRAALVADSQHGGKPNGVTLNSNWAYTINSTDPKLLQLN